MHDAENADSAAWRMQKSRFTTKKTFTLTSACDAEFCTSSHDRICAVLPSVFQRLMKSLPANKRQKISVILTEVLKPGYRRYPGLICLFS